MWPAIQGGGHVHMETCLAYGLPPHMCNRLVGDEGASLACLQYFSWHGNSTLDSKIRAFIKKENFCSNVCTVLYSRYSTPESSGCYYCLLF